MTLPIVPNGYDAPLFAVWTSGNRSLVSYKKFFPHPRKIIIFAIIHIAKENIGRRK